MNKTILFFLALVLAATTACGRGSSNNNPVKEETITGVQLFGSSDWLYSRFFFLLSSNYFNTVLLLSLIHI